MAAGSATADTRAVDSALRALGLDSSASWRDIRVAYATRVKQAHPDSSPGPGSRFLLERTIGAYRVLKNAYQVEERNRGSGVSTPARGAVHQHARREPSQPAGSAARHDRRKHARREPPQQTGNTAGRDARRQSRYVSMSALGNAALMQSRPEDRVSACVALGQTGKRSAAAYLRAALYDDGDNVVVAAAAALAVLRARSVAGDYACIYSAASQPVRLSIVTAAVQSGPAECFRSLFVKALTDSDRSVRRLALSGLSRLEPGYGV